MKIGHGALALALALALVIAIGLCAKRQGFPSRRAACGRLRLASRATPAADPPCAVGRIFLNTGPGAVRNGAEPLEKEGGTWMVEPPNHVPRQPKLHR